MSRTLSALALVFALASTANAEVKELAFDVALDDKPIGTHTFRIEQAGDEQRVEIDAAFDVRVLFIPVYSYRHVNTERWREGCLVGISSETDSNGKDYKVVGKEVADVFRVTTLSASRDYDAQCLMSFAYWDRRIVDQDRLLNAQTGELIDVEISPLSGTALDLPGVEADLDGYRIVSEQDDVDIKVFYESNGGRWMALETVLENGRVMRYLPQSPEQVMMLNDDQKTSAAQVR